MPPELSWRTWERRRGGVPWCDEERLAMTIEVLGGDIHLVDLETRLPFRYALRR